MKNLIRKIQGRVNSIIWSLIGTGVILIILAILIAWTEVILRLIVALFVLLLAYTFIFAGYKVWATKRDIEKYLNLR